jgi:hypothetical protein
MNYYLYNIVNERHLSILKLGICEIDIESKFINNRLLSLEDILFNYEKNLKLDFLILNYNSDDLNKIKDMKCGIIIIIQDYSKINECFNIIKNNNNLIILEYNFTIDMIKDNLSMYFKK